jgi:hypothetical protein
VELFGVADWAMAVIAVAVAGPLRSRVDARYTRFAVLGVCAPSAVVLLARSAVG